MTSRLLFWLALIAEPLPALLADAAECPTAPAVVQLDPLRVRGKPITCFGLGLQVYAHAKSKQVAKIVIEKVAEDSQADRYQVRPGAEIVAINHRDVRSLRAQFSQDGDLGALFVNRRRGARILLKIVPSPGEKPFQVELIQGFVPRSSLLWDRLDQTYP